MKSNLIAFALALTILLSLTASAQVIVTLQQPPPYQFKMEHMWKLTLGNPTRTTFNVYLVGRATERKDGRIVEATTAEFPLPPGVKLINPREIKVREVKEANSRYSDVVKNIGTVPTGDYEICVTVYDALTNATLGEMCVQSLVQNLTQIELLSPENGQSFNTGYSAHDPVTGTGDQNLKSILASAPDGMDPRTVIWGLVLRYIGAGLWSDDGLTDISETHAPAIGQSTQGDSSVGRLNKGRVRRIYFRDNRVFPQQQPEMGPPWEIKNWPEWEEYISEIKGDAQPDLDSSARRVFDAAEEGGAILRLWERESLLSGSAMLTQLQDEILQLKDPAGFLKALQESENPNMLLELIFQRSNKNNRTGPKRTFPTGPVVQRTFPTGPVIQNPDEGMMRARSGPGGLVIDSLTGVSRNPADSVAMANQSGSAHELERHEAEATHLNDRSNGMPLRRVAGNDRLNVDDNDGYGPEKYRVAFDGSMYGYYDDGYPVEFDGTTYGSPGRYAQGTLPLPGGIMTFSWMPPSPLPPGANVTYTLRVAECIGRQSPYDAIQSNPGVIVIPNIRTNMVQVPLAARSLARKGGATIGTDNFSKGAGGATIGTDNFRRQPGGATIGTDNFSKGTGGATIGTDNQRQGKGGATIGTDNQRQGTGGATIGTDTLMRSPGGEIIGTDTLMRSPGGEIIGTDTLVRSPKGELIGTDNISKGTKGATIGTDNQRQGTGGATIGTDNFSKGPGGAILGTDNFRRGSTSVTKATATRGEWMRQAGPGTITGGGARYAWMVSVYVNGVLMHESEVRSFQYVSESDYERRSPRDIMIETEQDVRDRSKAPDTEILRPKYDLFASSSLDAEILRDALYADEPEPTHVEPFVFHLNSRIDAQHASRVGTFSEMPRNFLTANLQPGVSLYGLPFTSNILLTTLQDTGRQSMSSFALNFDFEGMRQGLASRLEKKMIELPNLNDLTPEQLASYGDPDMLVRNLDQLNVISGVEKFFMSIRTLGFGTNYPSYSPYVLDGVPVTGVNLEMNPGIFYTAFTASRNQRPIDNESYRRNLYAGRLGIGSREGMHLHFSGLYVSDDAASIRVDPTNLVLNPRENYVFGAEGKLDLFNRQLTLEAEGAASMLTRDTREADFASSAIPNFVRDMTSPKLSSSVDYMYAGRVAYRNEESMTNVSAGVKMIGPGFASLGVPNMRTDQFGYEAKLDQQLFDRHLSFGTFFRMYHDNLIPWKSSRTTMTAYGVNLGLNFPRLPYLRVSFSPITQKNNASDPLFKFQNKMLMMTMMTGYSYMLGSMGASTALSFTGQNSETGSSMTDYKTNSYIISQSMSFNMPLMVGLSFGFIESRTTLGYGMIQTVDLNGSAPLAEFITAGVGVTVAFERSRNERLGFYANSTIFLTEWLDLDVRLEHTNYNDFLFAPGTYREFMAVGSLVTRL